MSLSFLDLFTIFLYGVKYFAISLAVIMLVSGIDDLIIDIVYWVRLPWRWLTVYHRHKRMNPEALFEPQEKPLAIMVPAWQETGVIGQMAENAARTLDYENYHIFIGTYPNDPATQKDVDAVCARFPNVHKVVCARPGPTSKADCLNNVLAAILQFEKSANFTFSGFILHDSEDVISPLELRLFNYLVDRKDLIQVPVYPFERQWSHFTSMSYIDEFAELHGKDVPMREAISGQVPSAGVGTCFSRRAVLALLKDGDGIAFDVRSLTEDYDIGFRLKEKGMSEIFVRMPGVDNPKKKKRVLQNRRSSNIICVREYFPDNFSRAVRQKSRWIVGIVFQGFATHGWTRSLKFNYFLWRDRKGLISNFVSFLATALFLLLVCLGLYQAFWPDSYKFLSIFSGSELLVLLLWANFFLMLNRMFQRAYFVTIYYGIEQGLLSVPRLVWGNIINFMANWRALMQVIQLGDPRRVAWDKTTHDFPSVETENRPLQRIGEILIRQGSITAKQLDSVLAEITPGLRLGGTLIARGLITGRQLGSALAEQYGAPFEEFDAWKIDPELIQAMPRHVALHYGVLPVREEQGALVIASENGIDPVSLSAIRRKLGRDVRYVIVPRGSVVTGIRRWYARVPTEDARQVLERAVSAGLIDQGRASEAWEKYQGSQLMLAEIVCSISHITQSAMNVLLLRHERSDQPIGKFLVHENIISEQTLERVLKLQKELEPTIWDTLRQFGVSTDALKGAMQEAA